ncbi:GTPase Era [Mycoplasma struthionis]|uniref:GTPase Era n=1 Tax=Mycoplasma struthionis TaxID=538220 RepID=UPI0021BD1AFD|nr:GTPase Era [Mycoplasma struthionis]
MKKILTVGLIGRPNVGKSTLLNQILDYKLAIVSNQAQTTRDDIKGIYNDEDYQIVFIDTPGIHKAEYLLSEKLNQKSYSVLQDVDFVVFLTPANQFFGSGDKFIVNKLNELNVKNKMAVLSKVDLVDDKELLNQKAKELKEAGFDTVMGIGLNLKNTYKGLLNELKKYAYESEPLYDEEDITDISLRFMARELIRESAIENLYQEIPHSITIEIDEFKEDNNENIPYKIFASLYVKKESQKRIVVGKEGSVIKKISMLSKKKNGSCFCPQSIFRN